MDDFTISGNSYSLNPTEKNLIAKYPPDKKEDWTESRFKSLKDNIKDNLIFQQFDRCAYCRKIIETDGYYEPIEHLVPKSLKPRWMFEPKNLVLTCNRCNNLKNDEQTLIDEFNESENFPEDSKAFKIINPHFDQWSHHLKYEDDIFLVAVTDSKGEETIRICKLDKFHIITNRAKELKLGNKIPLQRALNRLGELNKNSETAKELNAELLNAIEHFVQRMEDIKGYN